MAGKHNWKAWGGTLLVAALMSGCRSTPPPVPPYDFDRAEDILRAMHDRYVNRWMHTLVHVQFTRQAGSPAVPPVAYVAVSLPGRLRIDFEPRNEGNGVLVVSDTQYVVTAGRPTQVRRSIQPLLLLQHDVYFRNPLETMSRLRELGVDLNRVRHDRWDGRPVFVIGAFAGDLGRRQLWIDRELMLLVRWIEPSPRDPTLAVDTRFQDYEKLGAAWVARRIDVLVGGERVARYETRQVRANITLDTVFFRPDDWTQVQHWYQNPVLREVR